MDTAITVVTAITVDTAIAVTTRHRETRETPDTWTHARPARRTDQGNRPGETPEPRPGPAPTPPQTGRSAVGTLVERTTQSTILVHLPREQGYGVITRTKNGPALSGYDAITMKNAPANTMSTLPTQLPRSVTWHRGKEMPAHAQFTLDTSTRMLFAGPHSPRQRGTKSPS